MSNIDKQALNQEKIEWLNKLADMEYCKSNPGHWLMSLKDTNMLAKLALRSVALLDELEAAEKRIAELSASHGNLREAMAGIHNTITDGGAYTPLAAILNSSKRAYTAQPAPVSVPAAMEMDDDFDSAFEHGKAVGWNAYRAAMLKHSEPFIVTSDHRMMEMPQVEAINAVTAMLQGADGTLTNEGTIPVTQFKPVADLYGLTSPTGGETSFTFDAVEARDFIDGGWSCQEYVELERFQEAVSGNSPVIPDGWVACSERMPEESGRYWCYVEEQNDLGKSHYQWNCSWNGDRWWVESENGGRVTHWMPLPAAPQQEVSHALAKGMERYGDAMQELAKREVK